MVRWLAVQSGPGRKVSVVEEPKSHSFTKPWESSSKFSACQCAP